MTDVRLHKLESLIQREIAGLLMVGAVKDPRVGTHLSISRVKLSKDGSLARVKVSSWEDSQTLERGVEALNHASGFLIHLLAKKLDLRLLPKLLFEGDQSLEKAFELNKKIDRIRTSEGVENEPS